MLRTWLASFTVRRSFAGVTSRRRAMSSSTNSPKTMPSSDDELIVTTCVLSHWVYLCGIADWILGGTEYSGGYGFYPTVRH